MGIFFVLWLTHMLKNWWMNWYTSLQILMWAQVWLQKLYSARGEISMFFWNAVKLLSICNRYYLWSFCFFKKGGNYFWQNWFSKSVSYRKEFYRSTRIQQQNQTLFLKWTQLLTKIKNYSHQTNYQKLTIINLNWMIIKILLNMWIWNCVL